MPSATVPSAYLKGGGTMAVDIDSLQIEISATSDTATKRLEELAATLERLRSVMGGASTATNRQTAALQQMRTTVERTNRPLNNLVRNIRRTVAAGLGFYSIGRGLKSAVKMSLIMRKRLICSALQWGNITIRLIGIPNSFHQSLA